MEWKEWPLFAKFAKNGISEGLLLDWGSTAPQDIPLINQLG